MTLTELLIAWDKGNDINYKFSGSQYRLCHEGEYQVKYKKASEVTQEFIQHKVSGKSIFDEYPYLAKEISESLKQGHVEIPGYSSAESYDDHVDYSQPDDYETDIETKIDHNHDFDRYELLLKNNLISKDEYDKLKSGIQNTNKSSAKAPVVKKARNTNFRLSCSGIFLIFTAIILAVTAIMIWGPRTRIKQVYNTFDPDTINPKAGYGIISYDVGYKEYTNRFLSSLNIAKKPKDCGYIIKYKSDPKIISGYNRVPATSSGKPKYSTGGTPADVYQEFVTAEIYDIHTGKVIAKKTFEAKLASTLKDNVVLVSDGTVAEWIKEKLPKHN